MNIDLGYFWIKMALAAGLVLTVFLIGRAWVRRTYDPPVWCSNCGKVCCESKAIRRDDGTYFCRHCDDIFYGRY
jgi:hypothetical protein